MKEQYLKSNNSVATIDTDGELLLSNNIPTGVGQIADNTAIEFLNTDTLTMSDISTDVNSSVTHLLILQLEFTTHNK